MIKKSFQKLKANKKLFLLSWLCDLAFFIIFGFIYLKSLLAAESSLRALSKFMQENVNQLVQNFNPGKADLGFLLTNQAFVAHYNTVMYYIQLFIFSTFLLYLLTQSINWYLAHKIAKKKIKKNYFVRFFIATLIQFLLFIGVAILALKLLMESTLTLFPFLNTTTINILFTTFFIILAYFSLLSYIYLSKPKIKQAIKHIFNFKKKFLKKSLATFIIIILLILAVNYVGLQIFLLQRIVGTLFIAIISIGAYTFARVYALEVLN